MPQQHAGEKIFWEIGRVGGARATAGLDGDDRLFFRLVTATQDTYITTPLISLDLEDPKEWIVLWCGLQHFSQWRSRLFVAINGAFSSERVIENLISMGNWGLEGELTGSLGASLEGKDNAAFELVELAVLGSIPTDDALCAMLSLTHSQFKLPDNTEPYRLVGHYA